MKDFTFLISLFTSALFISCQPKGIPTSLTPGSVSTITSIVYIDDTFSFDLDTTHQIDTTEWRSLFIVQPYFTNTDQNHINKAIQNHISHYKNIFLEESPYMEGMPKNCSFRVDIEKSSTNESVISFQLLFSQLLRGDAHPVSEYHSFNYDHEKRKQIKLSDYFILNTPKDSLNLLKVINHKIEGKGLDDLNHLDFTIFYDGVSFNLGHYRLTNYSKGTSNILFDSFELLPFIQKEYQEE